MKSWASTKKIGFARIPVSSKRLTRVRLVRTKYVIPRGVYRTHGLSFRKTERFSAHLPRSTESICGLQKNIVRTDENVR